MSRPCAGVHHPPEHPLTPATLLPVSAAGDPVMDFRVFRYWDHKREALTDATLGGYRAEGGRTGPDEAFRTTRGLYELL